MYKVWTEFLTNKLIIPVIYLRRKMMRNGKIHMHRGLESRVLGRVTTGTVAQTAVPACHLSPVNRSHQQLTPDGSGWDPHTGRRDDIEGERFLPLHMRKHLDR